MASQKVKSIGSTDGSASVLLEKVLVSGRNWRLKWAGWLTGVTALTGLVLLVPPISSFWLIYANTLLVHVVIGFVVILPFLLAGVRHGWANFNGRAYPNTHHMSGVLLLVTVFLALASGIFMFLTSGVFWPWVLAVHKWAGLSALLLVVQHCRVRRQVNSQSRTSKEGRRI